MKSYAINSAWMLIEKLIRLTVTFIFIGLTARAVGPSDFGVISLGITCVSIMWAFSGLGLDSLILKEFSQGVSNEKNILATVYFSRLLLAAVALLLIFFGAIFFQGYGFRGDQLCAFFIVISSIVFYNFNTYNSYYQAKGSSREIFKVSILALCASTLVKTYVLYFNYGLIAFSVSVLMDAALILFGYRIYSKGVVFPISIKNFDRKVVADLWRQTAPMLFSSIIVVFFTRIDQVMVNYFLGSAQAGVYSVAVRVSEAYIFLPSLVAVAFFPMLAKDQRDEQVRQYFDIVFFVAVFSGIIVALISPIFIPMLFGESYRPVLNILNINIVATIFSVVGITCTNYLVVKSMVSLRVYRLLGGLILNVVLNCVLIPKLGVSGAAISSLISQIYASWLGNATRKETIKCLIFQTKTIITFGVPGTYLYFRSLVQRN